MEEVGAAAALPGAPQPAFCRTSASGRRMRKSGSANIFQGVNLRQLRRLFHTAGEPDAEQKARQVWRNRRSAEADEEDEDGDGVSEDEEEEDEGLAQALVGLRVRARNRGGIRAETSRGIRASGQRRTNDRTPSEVTPEDEVPARGARGGRARSHDPGDKEDVRTAWSRDERDPERYLHRIRH